MRLAFNQLHRHMQGRSVNLLIRTISGIKPTEIVIGLNNDGPMIRTEKMPVEDIGNLLVNISDLDREYQIKLSNFPNIIVVGPQSSGKTSLIDSLLGKSFLPKKNDLATKKPFNITTIRSEQTKFKIQGQDVYSEKEAADMLDRLNENDKITSIELEIHGPDVYNARITDLPGLYHVSGIDGNDEKRKFVKRINEEYIKHPNNIPIVVSAANVDPATNQAIQLVYKLGRSENSMGVLTKADLTKKTDTTLIQGMLNGTHKKYGLGFGWVATVLRNQSEIDKGMTVKEKEIDENNFFTKYPQFSPSGINTIRQKISYIQFQRIKNNVPKLLIEIDVKLEELRQSGTFLMKIMDDPKNKLVSILESMLQSLVGSSLERAQFEKELRSIIAEKVDTFMKQAINPKDSYEPEYSNNSIDKRIVAYHSDHATNPDKYKKDSFGPLFMHGLVSPIAATRDSIKTAYENESMLAASIPIIDPVIDDPLGEKRLQWNKFLHDFFNALLKDDGIQKIVYTITETKLLDYIKNKSPDSDGLAHKFAEYIVKEIGSKAYTEHIQFSIRSMIEIEKRPNVNILELSREISKMYPKTFTYTGEMFETWSTKPKLKMEIYSQEFNEAYLKAVSNNLSDKLYRLVAVVLMDNMVRRLLEMVFELFSKQNVEKETLRVNQKIIKLENIKNILEKFT